MALCLFLVLLGFVLWPAAIMAFPLPYYADKAMEGGRRLDPLPWRRGLTGEAVQLDYVIAEPTGVFAMETKAWHVLRDLSSPGP